MLILAICCMSLLIVSLDNTVLNVALPSMRREFDASVSGMQWTIDAYTLVIASLLMLAGATADRIGRRKVFAWGLVLFTAGSVLCSLAPGLEWLIAFRMIQAVGGAMLNPVALSIITNTFTDPKERARAIGVWGAVVGISMAVGPLIGGLLVDSVGWRSIFWINLPVGLVALVLTVRHIPESRSERPRRPDPVGQLLVMALLGAVTYAIIEGPAAGWTSSPILGCALAAVAALAGLLRYEPRRADPLIDPRFFRSVPFSGATVLAVSGFAALSGFLFLNTLYLQDVRGLDALDAGLHMLPMAAFAFLCAPVSGRLVAARGPRLPLLVAGVTMAASGVLFAAFAAEESDTLMFAGYVLFGIGFGLVNAPITNTALAGMPRAQAGVAAALASTSRQTGGALGVAVIGAVLAAGTAGGGSFATAARPAWWIITGCGLLVLLVGAATTGPWALATARRTAQSLEPAPAAAPAPPPGHGSSHRTDGGLPPAPGPAPAG
ncbi:MFS transporter [Streptomyces sp. NBC_00091]|uniref:MFS transporter n=1 Tax=Streptomyces sp. NBC_00091 TaxID=2975648 RepID=UPI002252F4DA|nr:MFS transporter [Streptomyces sp. NBC_00091]MCX5378445.1 MFS transporter [Streptomyces sp. NBC_00091]